MRLKTPDSERELRSHLHLVHGRYVVDEKTESGLWELHQLDHETPDYHFNLKHEHHDDEPAAGQVEEWSW
jgi:hypothetical protein